MHSKSIATFLGLGLGLAATASLAFTTPARAASLCDGLATKAVSAETLYDPGQPLAGVAQLPHQNTLTGCWKRSPYNGRDACRRADRFGGLNGRFGSCATYTAFSAAVAVARASELELPSYLGFQPEALVRLYDAYGNPWDTQHPGEGDFLRILGQIALELEADRNLSAASVARFRQTVGSYRELTAPAPALLTKASAHFNRAGALLPAELILDGWVLDHVPARYCPIRDNRGLCNTRGEDARDAHSALLVGRRLKNDACEALVRNSWKGGCRGGRYAATGRECLEDSDSVWIRENELATGLSGLRGLW